METKIYLKKSFFTDCETPLLENGELKASLFTYSTGVKAVKLENGLGSLIMLPFMGQMIWRMQFLGREMTMKSIFDEPVKAKKAFDETYGCFLMHCGLTAMGNPADKDTHTPHGELPIARYQSAYLVSGKDENGRYIGLGGCYSHKRCFEINYDFIPLVRLYEGKTSVTVTVTFKNKKDLPLEYFYLCHINHRPTDGSRLVYSAPHDSITVNHEVPAGYPAQFADKTNDYLKRLDKNPEIMDKIGASGQAYMPEIVFCCSYKSDGDGRAYTMQVLPDGTSCYVIHSPDELPFGIRWIARTEDEDALGMVLPATAEHKGYIYCKEHQYERYLNCGDSVTYHIETGLQDADATQRMDKKIALIMR